jgi:hypothetical protein
MIIRPFVYVYSVMKYGRRSYTPIKIAAVIDLISIFITMIRLIRASSSYHKSNRTHGQVPKKEKTAHLRSIEKKELMKRIWGALLRYLIRDPIFENYTKMIALKIFTTLRISPRIFELLISLVSYFRYYTYIA